MVDPKTMCRKHLLGEHVEIHMLVGSIQLDKSIKGFLDNGLVDPLFIVDRHDELAEEMRSRGYNHNSEIAFAAGFHDKVTEIMKPYPNYGIDRAEAERELFERCPDCRKQREQNHVKENQEEA